MSKFLGAALGLFVSAAFLAASSGATTRAAAANSCTATGSGTSYALSIAIPAGGAAQGGFAFGAPGVSVTNIVIASTQGHLSTTNLPANTTGAWLLTSPLQPGRTVIANLATSGPVTGSFTVVAANTASSTYSSPIRCDLASGSHSASNAFTINQHIKYVSAAHAWHMAVTVPGAGTVSALQLVVSSAGSGSKPIVSKSFVQARRVIAARAGTYTLTLRPTTTGTALLKANGSLKLKLNVAFSPTGGRTAGKIVHLTLRPKM